MPDVAELGRRVKAKYPQYANMDDAELGRRVRAKYPQYANFTDVAPQPEAPGFFENLAIGAKRGATKYIADPIMALAEAVGGIAAGDFRPAMQMAEQAGRGAVQTAGFITAGAPPDPEVARIAAEVEARRANAPGFRQTREIRQRADARAALDPSLTGKITRGGAEVLTGAIPTVAAGAASGGSLPVIAATAGLQSAAQPETAALNVGLGALPVPVGQAFRAGINGVRRAFGKGAAQIVEAEALPAARAQVRASIGETAAVPEVRPSEIPNASTAAASLETVFAKLETDNVEQIGAMIANANRRLQKNITPDERLSAWDDYNKLRQITADEHRALSQVLPARSYEPVGIFDKGGYSRNITDIPAAQPNAQLDANLRELEAFFSGQSTAPRPFQEASGLSLPVHSLKPGDILEYRTGYPPKTVRGEFVRAQVDPVTGDLIPIVKAGTGEFPAAEYLDSGRVVNLPPSKGPQIAGRMAGMARTPESPVSLPQLREQFPGMPKQQFDDEVLKLAEEGKLAIHRHDAPGLLSEAERNAMVKVGDDYYTAATMRGPSASAPLDMAVSSAAESAPRSRWTKAKDELLGTLGAFKSLRSTADISYPLRQGALLLLRPLQWRQAGKVWKEMFRGFRTKNFDAIKDAVENHPLAGRMDDAGLYRGTQATGEEAFGQRAGSKVSEIVRKTPIIKQSEQAYTAAADTQRVQAFEQYARLIDKAGLSPEEALKADKAAAEWINIATGRGSLGKRLDKAFEALNLVFFSPRYVASRLNVFNPAMYIRNASSPGGRVVLKQQMSDLMQFASVVATTMYLAKQAGADVGLNPNSPDFLKIRMGNWRYDPLAGLQQVMRLIYRVGADFGRAGRGEKPKAGQTATDIAQTFLSYKLSPPAGVFRDFINQRTVDRKPFTAGRAVADLTAPMQWADFVEAYQKEGWGGVAKAAPGFVGVGAQNYESRPVDAAIEKNQPLFSELQRLNKRVTELRKKEGEKDDAFNARVQQFGQNYTRFGQALLNSPRFQQAPDALKAVALDRLDQRAKGITHREFAFPELELDPNIIMDAAEQSKKNPANQ